MLSIQSPTLTLFHMNTCPHCVALMPEWNNVKKTLALKKIPCLTIEYHQMAHLPASLQNISGFPTIQVVKNNRVVEEYRGDRSHDSILQFALSHIPVPSVKPVASVKPVPSVKPKAKPASQKTKSIKKPSKKTI